MTHGRRETFFWLEAAQLLDMADVVLREVKQLDRAEQDKFWAGEKSVELLARLKALPDEKFARNIFKAIASHPREILEHCRVQKSHSLASSILICLARRELSLGDLDKHANEPGDMGSGGLRLWLKKVALASVGATGNTNDRMVAAALRLGTITNADVLMAKRKRKRRPLVNWKRIGILPRFLVDYWCGERGVYGQNPTTGIFLSPPLCFFSNKALATFCSICLGNAQGEKETSAQNVRKWVSRLRLARPKYSAAPRIREVKQYEDRLCFYR